MNCDFIKTGDESGLWGRTGKLGELPGIVLAYNGISARKIAREMWLLYKTASLFRRQKIAARSGTDKV